MFIKIPGQRRMNLNYKDIEEEILSWKTENLTKWEYFNRTAEEVCHAGKD